MQSKKNITDELISDDNKNTSEMGLEPTTLRLEV
jgi:hypothetical protein